MAGSGSDNRRNKDKARAAALKSQGVERMTQRCPQCYRIISCESRKSRYSHICK